MTSNSPVIRSPTHFKSRIPQKTEEINEPKMPTSPKTGRIQSKIPRSTSLKRSPAKNETEVVMQRQISEPAGKGSREEKCDFQSKIPRNPSIKKTKLQCVNGNTPKSGKDESASDLCNDLQTSRGSENGNDVISNEKSFTFIEDKAEAVISARSDEQLPSELESKLADSSNLENFPLNDQRSANDIDDYRKCVNVQAAYHEVHQQHPPSPTSDTTDKILEFDLTMTSESPKMKTTGTTGEQNLHNGNGSPKIEEEDLGDNFEKTEHDNDDYSTVTTTEYEKDGKFVKTTEVLNYTNDRNIKTIVTTTEKVITIPFGQKLDLNNPEITSSTTVRSKYLQTMLQSKEYEGDKEIKAETLETIETDVQTNKVDSNDNTDDPDLDTVLVILETLDEVRKSEAKIKQFSGTKTDDPVFIELMDVLTKCLSKFEEIDPKGRENVEQKRKNGIEYIQDQITKLNRRLQENQPKAAEKDTTVNVKHTTPENADKKELEDIEKQIEPETIKEEKMNVNAVQSNETKGEANGSPTKERKKSTLKKHFKIGSKNKSNGDQEKKKKKRFCVIS